MRARLLALPAAALVALALSASPASAGEAPPDLDNVACDASVTADWTPETWAAFTEQVQGMIAAGHNFGPPPCGQVEPDCQVSVDPPTDIVVTLTNLTVDGAAVPYTAEKVYVGGGAGMATFDLSAVVHGAHVVSVDATWNIGTGKLRLSGETTCAELPPPTTTTAPPVTNPPTTAPPAPTPPPTQPAPKPVCVDDPETSENECRLPDTGGGALIPLGLGALAGGGVLVRKFSGR